MALTPLNVVFDGDSLTAGSGASSPATCYVAVVAAALGSTVTTFNVGVGAETLATMLANAPTVVDPKHNSARQNIVSIFGGTNDLYFSDTLTAATLYANIVAYHDARHIAGFQTIAYTITPRSAGSTPANFESRRQDLNALIVAGWATFADALVDIGNDPIMGPAGAETNTTYYADLVHPTDAGHARIADFVLSAIAGIRTTVSEASPLARAARSESPGWHYIASRLHGDGTETFLDWDLPLSGVGLTHTLSGPDAITASINPEVAALKVGGSPLIQPWSTAIYAEIDGQIRCGAIVTDMVADGTSLTLSCIGFPGYAIGTPYTSDYTRVQVDPLDVVRHIWTHIQSARNGNIGLQVDPLLTGLKIGTWAKNVAFTTSTGENVSFTAGPYKLMWYQTTDLGKEIDALAKATPFEYREAHVWNGNGTIDHKLRLGYPMIGRRRHDLRFVVGENIQIVPSIAFGADYASEVLVLGAGTGRKMIRGTGSRPDGRLRRVAVVTDSGLTSTTKANTLARQEVLRHLGLADVTEVTILDHPHAPLGSFDVGDEILVQTGSGWADDVVLWCRVVSMTISPDSLGVARLSILRTDRITA